MELAVLTTDRAPHQVRGFARDLENVGWDAMYQAETKHDPFVGLAVAGATTNALHLRAGVAVALTRSPMTTAVAAHDLQMLTGGRFTLGLSSGVRIGVEDRYGMPWSAPTERLREYVQAVRAIWRCFATGQPLEFAGQFYRHARVFDYFNPGDTGYPAPPVVIGAVGPGMTRVAGEVADGFLTHGFTSRRYLDQVTVPALAEGRALAGLPMTGFRLQISSMVATGSTEPEFLRSVRLARELLAFYAQVPAYGGVLEAEGLAELGTELRALAGAGRFAEMPGLIDDKVLETFAVVGEPGQAARQLIDRYGDLADTLVLYEPDVADAQRWSPLYAELRRSGS